MGRLMLTDLSAKGALCAAALVLVASPAGSGDATPEHKLFLTQSAGAAQQLAQGSVGGAANTLANAGIDYWYDAVGEDMPAWAKRFEFELQLQEIGKPEWSVLTVQPLYESDDLQDTVFTQVSQLRYNYLGDDRDVTNVGLGYRRLMADNTVLVGANTFFDYDWRYNHQRASVGVEAKWSGLDLTANNYFGLSSWHSVGTNQEEKPLDGYDVELGMQVPYLPWARVYAKAYEWDSIRGSDIDGWQASTELDLTQNFQFEGGVKDDDTTSGTEGFATIRFHFAFNKPTATSSKLTSSQPWEMRDMRNYRLDKVRRENKVITERASSGVIIKRGT